MTEVHRCFCQAETSGKTTSKVLCIVFPASLKGTISTSPSHSASRSLALWVDRIAAEVAALPPPRDRLFLRLLWETGECE